MPERTLVASATRWWRGSTVVSALAVALATVLIGAAVGFVSLRGVIDPVWSASDPADGDIVGIFTTNLRTAASLFAGVATFGFSTIFGSLLLGVFIGATFAVASATVGGSAAAASIFAYAPIEFAGFLAAATAGLMPSVALLRHRGGAGRWQAYMNELRRSAWAGGLSVVLLIAAAIVEGLVIRGRL